MKTMRQSGEQPAPERVTDEEIAQVIRECAEDERRDARRERAEFAAWIEPLALRMAEELAALRAPHGGTTSIDHAVDAVIAADAALGPITHPPTIALHVAVLRLLAAIAALRAPVDVEGTLTAMVGAMRGVPPEHACTIADVVRPHVEDAARLARENETLRAAATARDSMLAAERGSHRMALRERDGAHQRLADMGARRDEAEADLAAARVEIERLMKAHAEAVEQRENLLAEVDRLRALPDGMGSLG